MTLKQKLAAVRMVMLDVDGVLSDGKIFYDDKGNELKSFHVHDGFGIARARKQGISFALISGRKSTIVSRRSKELHINDVFQGITDKVAIVDRLRRKYSLKKEQVCCMADDAHDVEFLQSGGLSVAPANAVEEVKRIADIVTGKPGGAGAVRELLDRILKAKKLL